MYGWTNKIFDCNPFFPETSCMKRVCRDKYVGDGTLVSSKELRAAVALRKNRYST